MLHKRDRSRHVIHVPAHAAVIKIQHRNGISVLQQVCSPEVTVDHAVTVRTLSVQCKSPANQLLRLIQHPDVLLREPLRIRIGGAIEIVPDPEGPIKAPLHALEIIRALPLPGLPVDLRHNLSHHAVHRPVLIRQRRGGFHTADKIGQNRSDAEGRNGDGVRYFLDFCNQITDITVSITGIHRSLTLCKGKTDHMPFFFQRRCLNGGHQLAVFHRNGRCQGNIRVPFQIRQPAKLGADGIHRGVIQTMHPHDHRFLSGGLHQIGCILRKIQKLLIRILGISPQRQCPCRHIIEMRDLLFQ